MELDCSKGRSDGSGGTLVVRKVITREKCISQRSRAGVACGSLHILIYWNI